MITQALTTFKTGDYDVSRDVAGTHVDGSYVPGATTVTTDVAMAIQPIAGRDLKTLPEGQKAQDTRLVLTSHELLVNDRIAYAGESWRVYQSQDWTLRGATWWRAYITRTVLAV